MTVGRQASSRYLQKDKCVTPRAHGLVSGRHALSPQRHCKHCATPPGLARLLGASAPNSKFSLRDLKNVLLHWLGLPEINRPIITRTRKCRFVLWGRCR
jgi:hypothetical protein